MRGGGKQQQRNHGGGTAADYNGQGQGRQLGEDQAAVPIVPAQIQEGKGQQHQGFQREAGQGGQRGEFAQQAVYAPAYAETQCNPRHLPAPYRKPHHANDGQHNCADLQRAQGFAQKQSAAEDAGEGCDEVA